MISQPVQQRNTRRVVFFFVSIAIAGFFGFLPFYSHVALAAVTATLSLSPTSSSIPVNQTFSVTIVLNTAGNAIDGVDVYSLHFNPAILQVVDGNASIVGVQITPGSLMPATTANLADNIAGTIQFAQASGGGSNYTGSGTLATINFVAHAAGTSAVTIDFTAGQTNDSNVSYQGSDLLASVTNGSYTVTVDTTPPTVSLTAPSQGATVSGSAVTVSATASDNIGIAGVQFKLDGANLGSEDTVSPYSITWDSTATTNGTHTLTAVARDAAGNQTTSSSRSVTVSNTFSRTIQLNLEGRSNQVISDTLTVLNSTKTSTLATYSYTTNSSGQATITFNIAPQTVYLKFNPAPFLARLFNVNLNTASTYTIPKLLIGDIVQDNIINSVDYSALNTHWFTADAASDLNQDGIVNSIDFSFMNSHWLVSGES